MHRQWYDWTMKSGEKPAFLKEKIAYFVVRANEWKYVDSLESIATEPDRYVYDPLDTRPGDLEMTADPDSLTDQRFALQLFGNGLVYHSDPFEEDTEISGYLKLEAWLAIDVPDTDFQVDVYEILLDGSSVRLTQDLMRARFRESLREPKLVTPGEINRYVFDGFYFFSRKITEGSRLRLVFRSPNSLFLQKNYNSGGVVAEESGADARTAHVTLYHDAEHPSFMALPIVD